MQPFYFYEPFRQHPTTFSEVFLSDFIFCQVEIVNNMKKTLERHQRQLFTTRLELYSCRATPPAFICIQRC